MQQFDLFTFIATIVNFIILVALLRIFLYDRIIEVINKRQDEMDRKWNEAEEEKRQAEEEKRRYSERNEEFKERKQQIISKLREEAEEKKKELLSAARDEVKEKKEQWIRSIERKEKDISNLIHRKIGSEVITLTKQLFINLADEDLQEKIIDRFIEGLKRLNKREREYILHRSREGNDVKIKSSFSLSARDKSKIGDALETEQPEGVHFVTDDTMNYGLELTAGDSVYAWNVDDYLDKVETTIMETAQKGMS